MDLAIVMPVYGQAAIMGEAVASALAQDAGNIAIGIVLVDDRCPDPETAVTARRLARAHPGRILYWRSPVNRGLSAMRNEGVRLALSAWPRLYAVTFLDGDDRLHPAYARRAMDALRVAQAETGDAPGRRVGWIYEDWDQFGIDQSLDAPVDFQSLYMLSGCQHTPGAACRADMFREGLAFDETLRGGDAEDWRFWVTALAAGWRGRHGGPLGFRYRRRVGGLAFEGARASGRNRVLMQKRFPELYHPHWLLDREAEESPRYLVLRATGDADVTNRLGVPGRRAGFAETVSLLRGRDALPTLAAPYFAVLAEDAALDALGARGLLDWAGWIMETLSAGERIVRFSLAAGMETRLRLGAPTGIDTSAMLIGAPVASLIDLADRSTLLAAEDPGPETVSLMLSLPSLGDAGDGPAPRRAQIEILDRLRRELARSSMPEASPARAAAWRPFRLDRAELIGAMLGGGPLLPDPTARDRSVICVYAADLRRAEIRDLLHLTAREMRARDGAAPSLLVLGSEALHPALARMPLGSLFPVPAAVRHRRVRTAVPEDALRGLVAGFGRAVSLECDAVVPTLNAVRRFGVETVAVFSEDPGSRLGQDLLTCFKVFRRALVTSDAQADRLLALGMSARQIDRTFLTAPAGSP